MYEFQYDITEAQYNNYMSIHNATQINVTDTFSEYQAHRKNNDPWFCGKCNKMHITVFEARKCCK